MLTGRLRFLCCLIPALPFILAAQITWLPIERTPFSKPVNMIASRGDTFLVAATDGLYLSTGPAPYFTRLLPTGSPAGFPASLITPNGTLFVSSTAAVFRSTNLGTTWTASMPYAASELVAAPSGTLYAVRANLALMRSLDNGGTWSVFAYSTERKPVRMLAVTDSILIVGTANGMFRTTDAGGTWSAVGAFPTAWNPTALRSAGNGIVLAASDSGIFRSTDRGATWSGVFAVGGQKTLLTLGSSPVLSAASTPAGILAVYQSTDSGASWAPVSSAPGFVPTSLSRGPGGVLFLGTTQGILFSSDGGVTLKRLGGSGHFASVRVVSLGSEKRFVAVQGEGVYVLDDAEIFESCNAGLTSNDIRGFLFWKATLFAAAYGQGIVKYNGRQWETCSSGITSVSVRCIKRCGNTLLAGTESGGFKSTNDGATWTALPGLEGRIIRDFSSLTVAQQFAATDNGVYRSTDAGSSWTPAPTGSSFSDVTSVICVAGESLVIAGVNGGGIMLSRNGGSTWAAADSGLPSLSVTSLAINSAGDVYAATPAGIALFDKAVTTWKPGNNPPSLHGCLIGIDPNDYLYCCTSDSGAFVSSIPTVVTTPLTAQCRWLAVGSYGDWFSSAGCEIEQGFVLQQQYGMRWPRNIPFQDMKAAKGLWLGTADFVETKGTFTPKVVHIGPRVTGEGEVFPTVFRVISKFAPPTRSVNGITTFGNDEETQTEVDPALPCDRMIISSVNTAIGITITRRILQFSQAFHDNYIITEYTLENTGKTTLSPVPQRYETRTGVVLYSQYRLSPTAQARYCVSNSSGWGANTMLYASGPWYTGSVWDNTSSDVRSLFAWHGYHPLANKPRAADFRGVGGANAATYDNIGAPLWNPSASSGYVPTADTTWRLGAAQFVGQATLHVDTSPSDTNDNPQQPATTNDLGSDDAITKANNQYDAAKMAAEYAQMTGGHSTRHALRIEPTGQFGLSRNDPATGSTSFSGYSAGTGYGPFTLAPDEKMRIVVVEGANGLSYEEQVRIGQQYRWGLISTQQKNDSVFQGQARLMETFRRARANFNSGYSIPMPPLPPKSFTVTSRPSRISLAWDVASQPGPTLTGFEIYRSAESVEATPELVYKGDASAREFEDSTVSFSKSYYYYIVSVGDSAENTGAGMTPRGALRSNRFYTQTFAPAHIVIAGVESGNGTAPHAFALGPNYPNPFNPATRMTVAIPHRSTVTVRVFDILGREVAVLMDGIQEAGTYTVSWNASSFPSGVYFCRMQAATKVFVRKIVLTK